MSPASVHRSLDSESKPPLHGLYRIIQLEASGTTSSPTPSLALPTTVATSAIATTAQLSALSDHGSKLPEIGGSSAGFIALVVVLSVIIVVCFGAVFFLLRNHSPTAHERRARQAYARDHQSLYEIPVGPPGMRSKFARLFGRKGGQGWVRAGGEDDAEWDAADGRSTYKDRDLREREGAPSSFYVARALSKTPHAMSADSVEVELEAAASSQPRGPPSPLASLVSLPGSQHDDPFASSPTSLAHSLPEAERSSGPRDPSHFSIQSGEPDGRKLSMRKFESGTKFREGLDGV